MKDYVHFMKVNGIWDLFSIGKWKLPQKYFKNLSISSWLPSFFFFYMCSSSIPYYQDTIPVIYFLSWD